MSKPYRHFYNQYIDKIIAVFKMVELTDIFRKMFVIAAFVYLVFYTIRGVNQVLEENVGIKVGTTPLTRNFSLPYITVCPRFKKSEAVGRGNAIYDITAEQAVDAGRGARDVTPLVE